MTMADVRELEDRVRRLAHHDLAIFRRWFNEFDASIWGQELEADVVAGRPDELANEALGELHEGRTTEL